MGGRGRGQGTGTGEVVLDSALVAIRSDVLARVLRLVGKSRDPTIGSAP